MKLNKKQILAKITTLLNENWPTNIKPTNTNTNRMVGRLQEAPITHVNTMSWRGRGTSVIMRKGIKISKVTVGGKKLVRHGSKDKGREVWTDYRTPRMSGTVWIKAKSGKEWSFEMPSKAGITRRR